MSSDFTQVVSDLRSLFPSASAGVIPLHAPAFRGNEREYLMACVDSTFVSSVGAFVDRAEQLLAAQTGAGYAVACVNGTSALHLSLVAAGVTRGDLVLTQPFSFVATANASAYTGATPAFLDIDRVTLGLSPTAVEEFMTTECERDANGDWIHRASKRRVSACVPMHSFGFVAEIDRLAEVCREFDLALIEDAAESLGSTYKDVHSGTVGVMGALSFNGNKIVTAGGGGMILTSDEALAKRLKHLSTQAKMPHKWEYRHDSVGYNYRMPNLNAALLCAQMEQLPGYLARKRALASQYGALLKDTPLSFLDAPPGQSPNFWLCCALLENREIRDSFLAAANAAKLICRPAWELLSDLPIFDHAIQHGALPISRDIQSRIVNLPSSPHHFDD